LTISRSDLGSTRSAKKITVSRISTRDMVEVDRYGRGYCDTYREKL
jgi:hypothetical protein